MRYPALRDCALLPGTVKARLRSANRGALFFRYPRPLGRKATTVITTNYRAHERFRTKVIGRLLSLDGRCNYTCTITDVSEGGARVSTPEWELVPDRLFLSVAKDGDIFECDVRWRRDGELGLRIIDSAARASRKTLLALCALEPIH